MEKQNKNKGIFLVLLFFIIFNNCSTVTHTRQTRGMGPANQAANANKIAEIKNKLLEGAALLLGKTDNNIIINDRKFMADCVNTVLAIYYYAGIDLARDFDKYTGNGVGRLFRTLEQGDLIYITEFPSPGDIVFWDNTWDRNGDGVWNDPLTHTGMIVKVDEDGNLEYVHFDYLKGIVNAKMNLKHPEKQFVIVDGKTIMINTPIQMKQKGQPRSDANLSGQLFTAFGKGYLME